jgi:hypothetical protein
MIAHTQICLARQLGQGLFQMPIAGFIALIRQIAGTYEQIWSRRHCRQLSNNSVKALAIKLRRII